MPGSVYVVFCKDGNPCRHPLDEGLWVNFTFERETADNDLKRLDDPMQSVNAKFLARNDPQAFSRYRGTLRAAKCGPHRVREFRQVQ